MRLVKENLLIEGFATEEGRKMDSIFKMIGYDGFHEFIGDNPGAVEVLTQWIDEFFFEQLISEPFDSRELERLGLYTAAEELMRREEDEE